MNTATMLGLAPLAHLVGDYLLQSDYMAQGKVERWWPAILHGIAYMLPFLVLTRAPAALLVIGGTHILIDHYRAAAYVIWARNHLAPRRRQRPSWAECRDNNGSAPDTPAGLAQALRIVADNTLHMVINAAALVWLA
ncbi:DUF3307 domain-containing protein [Nonomuraea sp. NPDC051941]|uniref:DUF3307 domain-containing protein n=1 Tax=Nonomuraea sp. NPDC051941 TaxID=3364373 RepID=UPI0037CA08C2